MATKATFEFGLGSRRFKDASKGLEVLAFNFGKSLDEVAPVLAQEIQVEQVILNLARNAIEAMAETPPKQRRLTLRGRRISTDTIGIDVEDTGPGLSRDVSENLFEPFVTTKTKGMGLGLSISAGIVEAHGGQLVVNSPPGTGAIFSFTLAAASGKQRQ